MCPKIFHLPASIDPDCHVEVGQYSFALRNYGCNCYPSNYDQQAKFSNKTELHFGANGKPFLEDDLDQACSEAFKNYRCFSMDSQHGDFGKVQHDVCRPGMQFEFHVNKNREIICGPADNPNYENGLKTNNHECKLRTCQIERRFSWSVLGIVGTDPMAFQSQHVDKYHAWDENMCVKGTNRGLMSYDKDACCGKYPDRRAYATSFSMCCPNGKVKPKKGFKSVEYVCGGYIKK